MTPGHGKVDRRTPLELTPEQFAEIGHRLVDDVADLLASMRERPLGPGETPQQIRAVLDAGAALPTDGADPARLMADTTRMLLEHSVYNGHPRFFGYITAGPAPIGILSDMLAAAVNPNVGAWALSPMASEIEEQAIRWLAEIVGFPEGGGGVLVSGGNAANMLGFWAARAAKAGWDVRRQGMCGADARRLRVYAGRGTHTWIQKATDLSGLGVDAIHWVDADARERMRPDALVAAIEEDLRAGERPFLVVGTAGTVSTGAVDPLPRLRAICDEHGLWLHVDGAYGAFAAASRLAPDDLRGLALADSVALDPHKWLYAPMEAGCTLVRSRDALLSAFSYRPEYYAFEDAGTNFFELGTQNSRGFRALKVWMILKHIGRDAYVRTLDQDIEMARAFFEICREHRELEALTNGLSITTYRYVPEELAARADEPEVAEHLNRLNQEIRDRMEKGGDAFVSQALLGKVYALRMCVVNFRTTLADVRRLAEVTVELGRAVDRELRPASVPA